MSKLNQQRDFKFGGSESLCVITNTLIGKAFPSHHFFSQSTRRRHNIKTLLPINSRAPLEDLYIQVADRQIKIYEDRTVLETTTDFRRRFTKKRIFEMESYLLIRPSTCKSCQNRRRISKTVTSDFENNNCYGVNHINLR